MFGKVFIGIMQLTPICSIFLHRSSVKVDGQKPFYEKGRFLGHSCKDYWLKES